MKILLTGGNGFIGSHIAKQLLDRGDEVIIYDNFSTSMKSEDFSHQSSEEQNSPTTDDRRLTTVEGDLQDSKKLPESLQGVDAVIHLASFISVEESVKNPLKYVKNNIEGAANLLVAMREAGVKKIVFSSSATVYGSPKTLPLDETAPLSAANPYAASKIAIEALCESFSQTDGFDVTILRYFNPYGPGENHQPETHAIPNFINAALNHQPIPLYWKGETVRDFIYIDDLAAAHVAVLSSKAGQGSMGGRGSKGGEYQVFNVSTGTGTKIIDIVNKLSDIVGYKIEINDLGERAGDVMATYASNYKLIQVTDWRPATSLQEGLRKTVDYFKNKKTKGD